MFGPPRGITPASAWPWVAHPVSGLLSATRRPIQTRFRYGSAYFWLNLATQSNSPAHSPRGTPSGLAPIRHRPPTACRHAVSGSFNSPHRGAFHLSLTVLVHYRSPRVFSLGRWTSQLPAGLACPAVLKVSARSPVTFAYEGVTRSAWPFQTLRLATGLVTPWIPSSGPQHALQPPSCNGCHLSHSMGLDCFPFARHYSGNVLSSWGYLDVSVPPVPPVWSIDSTSGTWVLPRWVPPFGYLRLIA